MPQSMLGSPDDIYSPYALVSCSAPLVRKPGSGGQCGASDSGRFGLAASVSNPIDTLTTAPQAGRQRGTMGQILLAPWRAGQALLAHEGLELSGYAAFTALLSLFPFLLFLTALAGFIGDANIAQSVVTGALDFAPKEVVDVLRPVIFEVLTQRHGTLLTVGIIFALWSASSGLEALRTLLNRSYGIVETRRIWVLRPQSILIVIVGTVLSMMVAGTIILAPLLGLFNWLHLNDAGWAMLRYGLGGALAIWMLIALHLALPNARLSLHAVWPGAVVTALLWLGGAGLFSVYVENFANFSITYGSLGGIILTLLFFYVTAIMFAYGAELNAALRPVAPEPTVLPAVMGATPTDMRTPDSDQLDPKQFGRGRVSATR
jgi:membrane protein